MTLIGLCNQTSKQETRTDGMGAGSQFAPQELCLRDVAYGLETDIWAGRTDVSFVPIAIKMPPLHGWQITALDGVVKAGCTLRARRI